MNHSVRNAIIKYSIGIAVCTGLVFLILGLRGVFSKDLSQATFYLAFTDAFTISGILFILFGLLIFLTNKGSLSAIAWSLKRFFFMFIPGMGTKATETYQEYKERRRPIDGFGFMFVIGGVFTAVGIVFLILFYKAYNG